MTYQMIADQVKLDTSYPTAGPYDSPQRKLQWITQAIFNYQMKLRVARCTKDIALSENMPSGQYKLPFSHVGIYEAYYETDLNNRSYMPVQIMDADQWRQRFQAMNRGTLVAAADIEGSLDYGSPPVTLGVTPTGKQILVYPTNQTGFITLHFIPMLPPYDPTNTDEWAGWGVDPTHMMGLEGPHEAFLPGLSGIIAYAKMEMVKAKNVNIEANRTQLGYWYKEYKEAEALILANQPSYSHFTRTPTQMGVVF